MRRVSWTLALGAVLALGLGSFPLDAEAHGWRHRHRHHHHHHGYVHGYWGWWGPRVVVGVAPPYWGVGPGWAYPPYWYDEPDAYVERPDPPREGYWHYCESAGGYYPEVPSCPEPWVKVPPTPE